VRFQEEALACGGYDLGGWNESVEELDRLIADSERSPSIGESEMRNVRAMIRLARGQADSALEDVRRAIELSRQQNEPQMVLPALAAAARVHAELGMVEQAREFAAELMGHPATRPLSSYRAFAWVAVELGYADALREKIAPARDASRWAGAMLAVIDGTLAEAAEHFSAMGLRPDEADARLRAARELIAAGRIAEAEAHLRRAIDYYRAEGASRYLEQAEALLPATAGRES
jgi:tetratricopeptide (TPR) repeat protein